METHDKKWAMTQMLNGKKVEHKGEIYIYSLAQGCFYHLCEEVCGEIDINSLPDEGWTLYKEPNTVLPEEILYTCFHAPEHKIEMLTDAVNQIIKHLKYKNSKVARIERLEAGRKF